MTTYKLKPLKWKRYIDPIARKYGYRVETVLGAFGIRPTARGIFLLEIPWPFPMEKHKSRSAAQQRAEEWYAERIMPALEPVGGKRGER